MQLSNSFQTEKRKQSNQRQNDQKYQEHFGEEKKDYYKHSHKKLKDSLEGGLDRILFPAKLEFPKILVPRLPQHTSDVNTECAGKSVWSKQPYYAEPAS